MRETTARLSVMILSVVAWGAALAGSYTGTQQSSKLYTAPDPKASGGIHGTIELPADKAPETVLAVSEHDSSLVYRGMVSEKTFDFSGLPPGKYDLVVVAADGFYEGVVLTRGEDTLTTKDRESIEKAIQGSVAFFDTKKIHRCEGQTGREGKAACVLQEVRTRPVTLQDATVRSDIQVRSLKLAHLEDVGTVGWQLGGTRELLRQEVAPGQVKGVLQHYRAEVLSGIRVADAVKDVGVLRLN